ncbi:hypothetical protein LIA77_04443 [Sarocladium implicatum]|nr:hypothetical protein LIA77_04443 [Sarocladium implicatum]
MGGTRQTKESNDLNIQVRVLADYDSSPSQPHETLSLDHAAIIANHQPAPTAQSWSLYSPHAEGSAGPALDLRRRAKDDDDEDEDEDEDEGLETQEEKSTKSSKKTTVSEEDSSPARTTTMEISATVSEPTGSPSPLPAAFDGNVASEFKSPDEDDSCPNFITNLLASDEFHRCYPVSMLLLTSSGFFEAQKQLFSIVRVLDAACSADVDSCSDFMQKAARNLTETENCETEWKNGLSTVMQAYRGLMSYGMMYTATCLQDPDSENYCFASAVTNTSAPSDTNLYFLPYNLSMPGSSTPSCTWCNQETMGIFHSAAANRRQLIATTYEGAARQVNTMCGQAFVNSTLPEEDESAGGLTLPHSGLVLTAIVVATVLSFAL